MKDWEKWEKDAQRALDLQSTISSGNQWSDPGDGVDRKHFTETSFPLIIDCKLTEKLSFRLDIKFLKAWKRKSQELGKIFAMPIRFLSKDSHQDWIVVPFEDFCWLVEQANTYHSKE